MHNSRATKRTPKCKCLHCGYEMDAVSDPYGRTAPYPGALCICLKCGAVMQLADDLTVTGLAQERIAELESDPTFMAELLKIVHAVHFVQGMHGRRN